MRTRHDKIAAMDQFGTPIATPRSLDLVSPFVALMDVAWITALSLATGYIYDMGLVANIAEIKGTLSSGFAVAIVYSVFAHGAMLYRPPELLQVRMQIWRSIVVWVAVFAFLAGLVFLLKSGATFSRGWVVTYLVSGIVATSIVRVCVALTCVKIIKSRWLRQNRVVIVGLESEILGNEALREVELSGYRIVATVSLAMGTELLFESAPLSRKMRDVIRTIRHSDADEVLIAMPWDRVEAIAQIAHELKVLPIPVRLVADRKVIQLMTGPLVELGGAKTVQLQRPPLSKTELILKKTLDLVLAALALIVLLPVFVIISAAIWWESPGRPLFQQNRMGFNGRPFKIYKFRTMRSSDDGPVIVQAKRNDSRITQIGGLLRKLSIDEVPQLINVLRGEMSLVGPRPHALAHDSEYDQLIATYAMRHKIKPGITGWAQISGYRGETPQIEMMQRRVESDLWYIESWSLWLDIRILALTVVRVMKTDNVY